MLTRAGQRHIQQAAIFLTAAFLLQCLQEAAGVVFLIGACMAETGHHQTVAALGRQLAPAQQRCRVAASGCRQLRQEHDIKFQALGFVHGHQFDFRTAGRFGVELGQFAIQIGERIITVGRQRFQQGKKLFRHLTLIVITQ